VTATHHDHEAAEETATLNATASLVDRVQVQDDAAASDYPVSGVAVIGDPCSCCGCENRGDDASLADRDYGHGDGSE